MGRGGRGTAVLALSGRAAQGVIELYHCVTMCLPSSNECSVVTSFMKFYCSRWLISTICELCCLYIVKMNKQKFAKKLSIEGMPKFQKLK